MAETPGIVALKNRAGPRVEVAAEIDVPARPPPGGFSIGYSADWNCAAALLAGADAWYSVVAGLLPGRP